MTSWDLCRLGFLNCRKLVLMAGKEAFTLRATVQLDPSKPEIKNGALLLLKTEAESQVKAGRLALPHQFSSVTQLCPTLCNSMNRSTLGLPVHHQLPEFTQTHVHRVGDAIQPSHPLSSPSPPAPNPSQHQGLFQ